MSEQEVRKILDNLYDKAIFHFNNQWQKHDVAEALASLKSLEPKVGSEEELWKIFAEVKGCKKDKEDCSFKKCHSWAGCDNLISALLAKLNLPEGKV